MRDETARARDDGGCRGARSEQISTRLSDASIGATISVGFAERGEEDGPAELIGRADDALISARRRPRG